MIVEVEWYEGNVFVDLFGDYGYDFDFVVFWIFNLDLCVVVDVDVVGIVWIDFDEYVLLQFCELWI